jgi:hypothetical protein
MDWRMRVLDWLKRTGNWTLTMLGLVALWGATCASLWSAWEAKRTADTIAKIEEQRLNYERDKYTSEINYRIADFVAKNHPILPCAQALNNLDSETELRAVLDEPSDFKFRLENPKHSALLECLDESDRQAILEKRIPWSADHRRKVRGLIIDWANQFDAVMSAFINGVANQYILCQNLASFTIRAKPTQTKILFGKIKKMEIWPGLPNLWTFMDRYPEPPGCEGFPGKSTDVGPPAPGSERRH